MAYLRGARGRFISALQRQDQEKKEAKLAEAAASVSEVAPVVKFGSNYNTSQIYSRGFEFAFMSKIQEIYKQACTFVFCKDFLHDAVWAHLNQKPWQIYGFKYTPGKDVPLDETNCVFAFRNTLYKSRPEDFHARRAGCQDLLNQIEKVLGFQPSRVFEVPHAESPCWLIIGDKGWQHAPPMVGLFTLFIRVGFAHPIGQSYLETLKSAQEGKLSIGDKQGGYAGDNDCDYIKRARKGIDVILKHGLGVFHPTIKENYPADLPNKGPSLHDAYGPVHFTSGQPRKAMPFWYRDEIWKSE